MSPDTERTVFAAEIMSESVITVPRNSTVQEAAQMMLTNRIGSVVVIDENEDYVGMLTERMMLPEEVMVPFMRGKTLRLLGREVGSIDNIEETMDEVRAMSVGDVMNTAAPTASPTSCSTRTSAG